MKFLQNRNFMLTGQAPSCEEAENDDTRCAFCKTEVTAKVSQIYNVFIQVFEYKSRGGLSYSKVVLCKGNECSAQSNEINKDSPEQLKALFAWSN